MCKTKYKIWKINKRGGRGGGGVPTKNPKTNERGEGGILFGTGE